MCVTSGELGQPQVSMQIALDVRRHPAEHATGKAPDGYDRIDTHKAPLWTFTVPTTFDRQYDAARIILVTVLGDRRISPCVEFSRGI
jgi:hypothetical protein